MDKMKQEREQGIGAMSKSMLIVMIFTMVSKLAGFLRETVLASQFGADAVASAYKTALDLPNIILMSIVAALAVTLIPVYTGLRKQGKEATDRFMSNLYTVGMAVSVVVLILTGIFLEPLRNIVMQGSDDAETRELVLQLAWTMMPMGIFVFLSRISNAYLQANDNFTVPAVSLIFLNLVTIASILLSRGTSIMYVAIGTVAGWAMQFLIQLPAMRRTKLSYRPTFDLKEPGLREVMVLILPILIASAFDQVYLFFDKMVAWNGDTGDPAKLDYAIRLTTMVSSVLLTTVATVLYPSLVRNVDDREGFAGNLSFGVNLNMLIAIPATVAMIVLCVPVIRIVYERGEFLPADTAVTAQLLGAYAAGMLGVGLRELCNRCFFAFKETIVPTIVGIGAVILNIALNYALHPLFGAAGIAIATAISSTASGASLLLLLHFRRQVVDWRRIGNCLWKTVLATGAMTAAVFVLYQVLHLGTAGGMTLLGGFLVTFVVGVAVYVGMLFLLKTEELRMLTAMIRRKLKRA